jgi:hypothetical protein
MCLWFKMLLAFARAVIHGSESRNILLSQIRDSPNLEGQVPVFISSRNRVAQLYPQALGSLFVASYDSRLHTGCNRISKLSYVTTDGQSASVLE